MPLWLLKFLPGGSILKVVVFGISLISTGAIGHLIKDNTARNKLLRQVTTETSREINEFAVTTNVAVDDSLGRVLERFGLEKRKTDEEYNQIRDEIERELLSIGPVNPPMEDVGICPEYCRVPE